MKENSFLQERIKNYISTFSNVELLHIDKDFFKTRCKIHDNVDIHKTKTFYKNYIKRNSSPCKICRNEERIKKIKNTLGKRFSHLKHLKEEKETRKIQKKQRKFQSQIERAKKIHNNYYSYEKITLENFENKYWTIICPKHGEFKQLKKEHLRGSKCFHCYVESISYNYDRFVKKFLKNNEYLEISESDYKGYGKISRFKCKIHGYFYAIPEKLVKRGIEYGCKKCLSNKSLWEEEVKDFIEKNLQINVIERNKIIKTNNSKFEIDIFCPEYNIGIECNGIYFHSDKFCDKNYHLNKTKECEKINVKLIQIFEDEWKFKKEIVKNILKNTFNKNHNVIYARNLVIKTIPENIAKSFYEKYHIQGWCRSSISFGAYNGSSLVACMSFSRKRPGIGSKKINDVVELTRYATDGGRYPGLATKIFKYYLKNYHKRGEKIITYADKRYYSGNVYLKMGFKMIRESGPNYYYVIGDKRYHRYHFSKMRLKEIFGEEICHSYSEKEIMENLGILKIYDCGHLVFEYSQE